MTENDQRALTTAFDRWFRGDVSAMRMCALLVEVAHVWDDLVDCDKVVTPAAAERAFRVMLVELPTNKFYRQHFDYLQPVITSVWAQWRAATDIEQNDVVVRDDRAKCYMLRASLYQLFHSVALLCGGLDWAAEVGPEIYRTYREHPENFDA
mgnify:CR=1 FL=1